MRERWGHTRQARYSGDRVPPPLPAEPFAGSINVPSAPGRSPATRCRKLLEAAWLCEAPDLPSYHTVSVHLLALAFLESIFARLLPSPAPRAPNRKDRRTTNATGPWFLEQSRFPSPFPPPSPNCLVSVLASRIPLLSALTKRDSFELHLGLSF